MKGESYLFSIIDQDGKRARVVDIQSFYLLLICFLDILKTRVAGKAMYHDYLFFLPINLRIVCFELGEFKNYVLIAQTRDSK